MSLDGRQGVVLIFLVIFGSVFTFEEIPQDVVPVLYSNYKEAVDNALDDNTMSLRRIFKHNKEYKIHVKKLKEVNGFKRHNLILRTDTGGKPLIYINNPVETKIPNAYLSLDEFKQLLTDRVSRQREKFKAYTRQKPLIMTPTRTTMKNVHVYSTIKSKPNKKTSKKVRQNNIIESFNKSLISTTKKLRKSENKITIDTTENNVSTTTTPMEKDVNDTLGIRESFTKNDVTKMSTTEVNKSLFNGNTLIENSVATKLTPEVSKNVLNYDKTTIDKALSDTKLVDGIETTPIILPIETTTSKIEIDILSPTEGFTSELDISTDIITKLEKAESEVTKGKFVNATKATILSTTTTPTTTKATRRTLSRPLVFMGGYK